MNASHTPDIGLTQSTVISVDAMGGDLGPAAVVAGAARSARKNPDIAFILHGPETELAPLVAKYPELQGKCTVHNAVGVVQMSDKPSQVMRSGKDTSMWSAIDAVRDKSAAVCVSCGNTGALMALSMVRLRKLPGVNRPAIAVMWPSRNPQGYNVMLDVGADIRADGEDLANYALMGVAYAREGLGLVRPRVGLLNVGTEENKGRAELKDAQERMEKMQRDAGFDYVGFVEGGDIGGTRCDVIVTDGFTGNIALKTGEGTAKLIGDFTRDAFTHSLWSKLGALFARGSLMRLRKRMDPRRSNGGVFIGLNGTVVKSHGSADELAVSSAIKLAFRLAQSGFTDHLAARVASAAALAQDDPQPQQNQE